VPYATLRHRLMTSPLCFTSARALAGLIARRKVSAREVMQAHLAQIARLNPQVNAIVAKLPDEACLALADAADARQTAGDPLGAELHVRVDGVARVGVPVAEHRPEVGQHSAQLTGQPRTPSVALDRF